MEIGNSEYYAGIGSRKTPQEVLIKMVKIANRLEQLGFHLRSGHAPGADQAFEAGVDSHWNKSSYLPWPGFEDARVWNNVNPYMHVREHWAEWAVANEIMSLVHPVPHLLTEGVTKLHTRNIFQIAGGSLNNLIKLRNVLTHLEMTSMLMRYHRVSTFLKAISTPLSGLTLEVNNYEDFLAVWEFLDSIKNSLHDELIKNKELSQFVVYYAPYHTFRPRDGVADMSIPQGGTATAVTLARFLGIPTFNLALETETKEFLEHITKLKGITIEELNLKI